MYVLSMEIKNRAEKQFDEVYDNPVLSVFFNRAKRIEIAFQKGNNQPVQKQFNLISNNWKHRLMLLLGRYYQRS